MNRWCPLFSGHRYEICMRFEVHRPERIQKLSDKPLVSSKQKKRQICKYALFEILKKDIFHPKLACAVQTSLEKFNHSSCLYKYSPKVSINFQTHQTPTLFFQSPIFWPRLFVAFARPLLWRLLEQPDLDELPPLGVLQLEKSLQQREEKKSFHAIS